MCRGRVDSRVGTHSVAATQRGGQRAGAQAGAGARRAEQRYTVHTHSTTAHSQGAGPIAQLLRFTAHLVSAVYIQDEIE